MKPSEIVFNDKITNRDKFGYYVRERRLELGITLRSLAESLGISPAYLSDIEKGNRMAPLDHLESMAMLLAVEEDEEDFFIDLSGCSHSNWPEINEYLSKTKGAREALRLARNMGMSGEEFFEIVSQMAKESKNDKTQIERPVQKGE